MNNEQELPMLAGIAGILRWIEELLNLVNGPLLMAGAFIALVDLLTDGKLTATNVTLLYLWAGSQALGIDTQLLGCFARARAVLRQQRGWAMAGWLVLGVVLGFAAWQAGYVFAVQQSEGISEASALAQLGMDPHIWLGWRMFLAVGLVALSGWTRYHPPTHNAAEAARAERERLEREAELEPLRQRVRANKALGWVGLGQQIAAAATGKDLVPPDRPPTGGGTPSAAPVGSTLRTTAEADGTAAGAHVVRVPTALPRQRRVRPRGVSARGGMSAAERRVRAALAKEPGLSKRGLAKKAKVSESTASKYLRLMREQEQIGQVAQ